MIKTVNNGIWEAHQNIRLKKNENLYISTPIFNYENDNNILKDNPPLKTLLQNIDENNVLKTFLDYMEENDQTLIDAICREKEISKEEKIANVQRLMDLMIKYMKNRNNDMYTEDIEENFHKMINFVQKRKLGFFNTNNIKNIFGQLIMRYGAEESKKVFNHDMTDPNISIKEDINIINIDDVKLDEEKYKIFHDYCIAQNESQPNKLIDNDIYQGMISDCWLLASIQALTNNENALNELQNLIEIDEKGNTIVNLKGVNKKYEVTKEELNGKNEFARGDMDVRAIEIAFDKYLKEENLTLKWYQRLSRAFNKNKLAPISINLGVYGEGSLSQAFSILFGAENLNTIWVARHKPDMNFILSIKDIQPVIITGSLSDEVEDISAIYQNGEKTKLEAHHAYSIKAADENIVKLVNPRNTSNVITISTEDYLKYFDFYYKYDVN